MNAMSARSCYLTSVLLPILDADHERLTTGHFGPGALTPRRCKRSSAYSER